MIRPVAICLALGAVPAHALTLAECERVTHVSHGGESGHVDFGAGRVGWDDWWSQEGVYLDLLVAHCETGDVLRTRVLEERISPRPPFDRTNIVRKIIATEMAAAPALFSFERLAEAIHPKGRDIKLARLDAEPCACAALYPDLQGDKTPYEASQ
ncbi:MAG: hypothetical protein QNJ20_05395 [Paracoccaceae bacterium]|nr:hypothetical protein [Paracoccaceae bacterium]